MPIPALRTPEQLLEQLYKVLPEDLRLEVGSRLDAVLYGLCAALAQAETTAIGALEQATISNGEGPWLRMHARGLGVPEVQDETDELLRIRMRTVELRVTRQAILDAVNNLLAIATASGLQARMLERMDGLGFCLERDPLEGAALWCEWNRFLLSLPLLPPAELPFMLEQSALEGAWLESSKENAIYPVIRSEVDRIRAAGVLVTYVFYYLEE